MEQQQAQGCRNSFGLWEVTGHCGDPMLTLKMEVQDPGRPAQIPLCPLRSPHPVGFEDSKFWGGHSSPAAWWGPSVPGLQGHQCIVPGERRWQSPGRISVAAQPCSVATRKSLSKVRDVPAQFRTASPMPQAPLRSSRLCTMPASGALTPQGWRRLAMRGALPPLTLAALRLGEAWVTPPVAVVTARGAPPAPTVPAAALLFTGPGRSAFGQKTGAGVRSRGTPERRNRLPEGLSWPLTSRPSGLRTHATQGVSSPSLGQGTGRAQDARPRNPGGSAWKGRAGSVPTVSAPPSPPACTPIPDGRSCPQRNRKPAPGFRSIMSTNILKTFELWKELGGVALSMAPAESRFSRRETRAGSPAAWARARPSPRKPSGRPRPRPGLRILHAESARRRNAPRRSAGEGRQDADRGAIRLLPARSRL